MAILTIKNDTLAAIGDAIREKTGKSDLIAPGDMPNEIRGIETGGGDIEVEPIVLSGDCSYSCSGPVGSAYVKNFGNTITTTDITNANNMFRNSSVEQIPFDINCRYLNIASNFYVDLYYMFYYCENLKTVPKINNCHVSKLQYLFSYCKNLREIPQDFCDTWGWKFIDTTTSSLYGDSSYMFDGCMSLRKFPMELMRHGMTTSTYNKSIYYYGFKSCFVLDEVVGLPFPHKDASWTGNAFNSTFSSCCRLKRMTFATQEDGTPYTMKWKNQTIDLTNFVGYDNTDHYSMGSLTFKYNSGITDDKKVYDDATYQALKDDPDWFPIDIAYSRYNHDSAVETINSLPDCSATGTNTIKFKGDAGSATDGGAINTLTEEEIAVAAAKGWTVSFT